jgi:nitrogen regulatory protein PII
VNIRQSKEKLPKYRFEVKVKKDDVKTMAENIVQRAMEEIGKNK